LFALSYLINLSPQNLHSITLNEENVF